MSEDLSINPKCEECPSVVRQARHELGVLGRECAGLLDVALDPQIQRTYLEGHQALAVQDESLRLTDEELRAQYAAEVEGELKRIDEAEQKLKKGAMQVMEGCLGPVTLQTERDGTKYVVKICGSPQAKTGTSYEAADVHRE